MSQLFHTHPPRYDVLPMVPELQDQVMTTVRLHPRPEEVDDPSASKIGGLFLWPEDEPWPEVPAPKPPKWWLENIGDRDDWPAVDAESIALVPVLQLRKDEFPEIEFRPGTDLLQLMWCPLPSREPNFGARPYLFWRDSTKVEHPLDEIPEPDYDVIDHEFLPTACRLHPERVIELPSAWEMSHELRRKLDALPLSATVTIHGRTDERTALTVYEWELSTCPSTKVGGHVYWGHNPERPQCSKCKQDMTHLLTLSENEWDAGTGPRWCPVEDSELLTRTTSDSLRQAPAFSDLSGRQYIFICRNCRGWPITAVTQR